VIGDPPSLDGAAHEIAAVPLPATAETFVGALGAPTGVTADDGSLAGESPTPLVATTANVYVIPFVSPEQEAVNPDTSQEAPGGADETEYDVTGDPPSLTGAVHDTDAEASPATALTPVGAAGTSATGVTRTD
jgi:hypothetical protein